MRRKADGINVAAFSGAFSCVCIFRQPSQLATKSKYIRAHTNFQTVRVFRSPQYLYILIKDHIKVLWIVFKCTLHFCSFLSFAFLSFSCVLCTFYFSLLFYGLTSHTAYNVRFNWRSTYIRGMVCNAKKCIHFNGSNVFVLVVADAICLSV